MNSIQEKIKASKLNGIFDYHVTFNKNPDHLEYSSYYGQTGLPRLTYLVFAKKILITTIGPKEFLFGLLLKFIFFNSITHSIHDWDPHPGKKYYLTKIYNLLASKFFQISFYSFSEQKKFSKSKYTMVHRLPIVFKETGETKKINQILLFGRNEVYKNFSYVEKLEKYAKRDGFKILIISKNYESASSDTIQFIKDFVSNVELFEHIRKSKLVLVPYTSATQSGVVIKSLENGTPVAVSNIDGLLEDCSAKEFSLTFELDEDPALVWEKIVEYIAGWSATEFYSKMKLHADAIDNSPV